MIDRFRDGLPYAERAIFLNPNSENARMAIAGGALFLRRWDEAIEQYAAYERLAPNGQYMPAVDFNCGIAHLCAGRIGLALERAEKALLASPVPSNQLLKVLCLAGAGNRVGALEALCRLRAMSPELTCAGAEALVRSHIGHVMENERAEELVFTARALWDATEPMG